MVSKGPDYQCMLKPLSETWLVQGKAHIYEFWRLYPHHRLEVSNTNRSTRREKQIQDVGHCIRKCTLMFLGVKYKTHAPILHKENMGKNC